MAALAWEISALRALLNLILVIQRAVLPIWKHCRWVCLFKHVAGHAIPLRYNRYSLTGNRTGIYGVVYAGQGFG